MKYRIVSNGKEFKIQEGIRMFWIMLWFDMSGVYRTQKDAEEALEYYRDRYGDSGGKFKPI